MPRYDSSNNVVDAAVTWAGTGPESLFNAPSTTDFVGDLNSNAYDQEQPGTTTGNGSATHDITGPESVNVDGPADNIRGHWRLQIGADNDLRADEASSAANKIPRWKGRRWYAFSITYNQLFRRMGQS